MAASPVIVATWRFGLPACRAGWSLLSAGGIALDAVEAAANVTEEDPAEMSVGYGGLPNAEGVVELDAAIMDGRNHNTGAVAGLSGIRKPITVARLVMEQTPHSMLVGANARRFALHCGMPDSDLLTDASRRRYAEWRGNRSSADVSHFEPRAQGSPNDGSHDTIGICAMDANGDLAAGCTTSGLAWKMPGRVGDSPIVGSGLYLDNGVGAAVGTGDGDEMMKCCLSYRVVLSMERGMTPDEACSEAIEYLIRKRAGYLGRGAAVLALRRDGLSGSAATASGFNPPDRGWCCACADSDGARMLTGPYIPE